MGRILRGVVAGCATFLALAGSAHAGTLSPTYLGYVFQAAPGETNVLVVSNDSSQPRFLLSDLLNPVTHSPSASGCTSVDADTVSCPFGTYLHISTGDGNDALATVDSVPMQLVVTGGSGDDNLNGGGQDDVFWQEAGKDEIDGDGGSDMVRYDPWPTGVTVDLATGSAPAGGRLQDVENLAGTPFQDNLTASPGDNIIAGGNGSDMLRDGGEDSTRCSTTPAPQGSSSI
jgi:Ca2+-binding RTX toxin-like protein